MFFKEWEILLVDDEPDVLSVSKLAMQDFTVYGLPVKINTASSKAEAVEFLSNPMRSRSQAIAFVDVVMESDSAGLELCQSIREMQKNKITQLFIRTGQPGIAPEQDVIDRYDINGYFTKAEATETKLYSLVKSGVRQYLWALTAQGASQMHHGIVAASTSRENILAYLQARADKTFPGMQTYTAMIVDNNIRGRTGWSEQEVIELWQQLKSMEGMPMGNDMDKYVQHENVHLTYVAAKPEMAECGMLQRSGFDHSDNSVISLYHTVLTSLATLWQRAS